MADHARATNLGALLGAAPAGAKSWRLKYRFGTRPVGTYPKISLQEARERALMAGEVIPSCDALDSSQLGIRQAQRLAAAIFLGASIARVKRRFSAASVSVG